MKSRSQHGAHYDAEAAPRAFMTIGNDRHEEYKKLRQEIDRHMVRYYDQDDPEISDSEYDALMRRLREIERDHPEWVDRDSPTQKVGGHARREAGVTVTHRVPMLSIQDVFTEEEVTAWAAEVLALHPDAIFSVEHKIDGLSMTLRFTEGKLTLAETRGDGRVGEDVTLNARTVPDVPETLPFGGYLELRGEVYMSHAAFDRFNEEMEDLGKKRAANPRNLAAGTLRQLDPKVTKERGLSFFIFNIQDAEGECAALREDHLEGLAAVEKAGAAVVPRFPARTPEEVIRAIRQIGEERGAYPYDIDGAVVKISQTAYRADFPAGSKYSPGHIAYKYPPEEKEVEVQDIEVDVGRTGKLTFRALFREPVRLCGTEVRRATLHNADHIRAMSIDRGCRAICRKQGEIIPAIVRVTRPTGTVYQPPTVCPVCGEPLASTEGEPDIWCVNPSCPAQLVRTLTYFVSKDAMDIKALGPSLIRALVEGGYVRDCADLYTLEEKEAALVEAGVLGREKNTRRILDQILSSKENDAARLLTGLAIRNVGRETARAILSVFPDIPSLQTATATDLTAVPDVGEITARSIVDFFAQEKNREILERLICSGVNVTASRTEGGDSLSGLTIVVTGTLPTLGRKEVKELIEGNGGKCTSAVSKKTDFLVAGEDAGSKLKKAKELGIRIIGEEELLTMVREGPKAPEEG